jgi:hypothetical protein
MERCHWRLWGWMALCFFKFLSMGLVGCRESLKVRKVVLAMDGVKVTGSDGCVGKL